MKEQCPNCEESVPAPGGAHGIMGQPMHSNRDCPKCGEPLIWFTEGHFKDAGWMPDEAERRRRALVG